MYEKKFTLSMKLTDFPVGHRRSSENEIYFGVPWCLSTERTNEHLAVFLHAKREKDEKKPWSIHSTIEMRLVTATGGIKQQGAGTIEFCDSIGKGWRNFASWKNAVEEITDGKQATLECDVIIDRMTGIVPMRQRSFEKPEEHVTDMILKIGEEKFHVSKTMLAAKSPHFKTLFFGNFDEAKKKEIELKDVDPEAFQKFLENIDGYFEVTASNVIDLLELGDRFDVKLMRDLCEQHLQESTEVGKKEKLKLADVFKLENLMEDCLNSMKDAEQIRAYLPKNHVLSKSTIWAILQKNNARR